MNTDIRMLTTKDVADALNISLQTVQKHIRAGKLKATYINGRYYIAPETIQELIDAGAYKMRERKDREPKTRK